MGKPILKALMLGMVLCSGLYAETRQLDQPDVNSICGPHLSKRDVLVLDLQPMRNDPEGVTRIEAWLKEIKPKSKYLFMAE